MRHLSVQKCRLMFWLFVVKDLKLVRFALPSVKYFSCEAAVEIRMLEAVNNVQPPGELSSRNHIPSEKSSFSFYWVSRQILCCCCAILNRWRGAEGPTACDNTVRFLSPLSHRRKQSNKQNPSCGTSFCIYMDLHILGHHAKGFDLQSSH